MKKFIMIIVCLSIVFAYASDVFNLNNYTITFTQDAPRIDGILNDSVWNKALLASNFTQYYPLAGMPASSQTEVRVLYDSRNIYVAARMYDDPALIAKQLLRRDNRGYADEIGIGFDSYNDNRTAFTFSLSPMGNKQDRIWYNDQYFNTSWDAVWEGKTHIDDKGWTAEFRIPLSQIRYKEDMDISEWGIQFYRYIARNDEHDYWSPLPEGSMSEVAAYGILRGIDSIPSTGRLEILPYVSGGLLISNAETKLKGQVGADIKTGLGSNFTLTATIIPDFGQVEADPANVNLSADETYYSEKRPFFLEGGDIFKFGPTRTLSSDIPYMFYSRRIGRTPRGNAPADVEEVVGDIPNESTIASAVKLSGKTQNGWSVGILDAITTEEYVTYIDTSGQKKNGIIEPLSNTLITRIKKDFNEGNTTAGFYLSNINRNLHQDILTDQFTKHAAIGGLDFEHRLKKYPNWIISGLISGSYINASTDVITSLQRQPQRYFQRPDADYLEVDTSATSLSGYDYQVSIMKQSGKHFTASLTFAEVSPGFEVNDIGYQTRADYRSIIGHIRYAHNKPGKIIRSWSWGNRMSLAWNFNGELTWAHNTFSNYLGFQNFWYLNITYSHYFSSFDDRLTRGGPIAFYPAQYRPYITLGTDTRKKLSATAYLYSKLSDSGSWNRNLGLTVSYRPLPSINFKLEASDFITHNTGQYITTVEDDNAVHTLGSRYIFADADGHQAWVSARVEWIISPDLTLQFVSRPFISSYSYTGIKEMNEIGTYNFDAYGDDIGSISGLEEDVYSIDPDRNGPAASFDIYNPDFNYHALQTTAVLRWEYKPGSILYLVWQQEKTQYLSGTSASSSLNYVDNFNTLYNMEPTNTFLLKFSYWFGGF